MARYILTFARAPSDDEILSLTRFSNVKVLDSGNSSLLVEGEPYEIEKIAAAIPNTTVVAERGYFSAPEQGKVRLKLRR